MAFAIKAGVIDPRAKTFSFAEQKTMYGGKQISKGDAVFIFARTRVVMAFARMASSHPQKRLRRGTAWPVKRRV